MHTFCDLEGGNDADNVLRQGRSRQTASQEECFGSATLTTGGFGGAASAMERSGVAMRRAPLRSDEGINLEFRPLEGTLEDQSFLASESQCIGASAAAQSAFGRIDTSSAQHWGIDNTTGQALSGALGISHHNFRSLFNPQVQLHASTTTCQQLNPGLWTPPAPMFFDPMFLPQCVPPSTASVNGHEGNNNNLQYNAHQWWCQ